MSSTGNEKNVGDNLDLKAGKDGTKIRGSYRGTRAGKRVQAAKQANENKKQERKAKNTEMSVSMIKKTAMLLNHIADECSFTQSTGKPKNVPKAASLKADGNIQGRSYRGTRAGKRVKVKQKLKKVAVILNAVAKNI